jgi:hypothetical protein
MRADDRPSFALDAAGCRFSRLRASRYNGNPILRF